MSKPKSLDDFITRDGDDDLVDCDDDVSFSSTDDEESRSVSTSSSKREKQEVYKMSAKDTFRVQLWRVAVTVVLLLTAFAVTYTTYRLLKQEEQSNFEVAVSVARVISSPRFQSVLLWSSYANESFLS